MKFTLALLAGSLAFAGAAAAQSVALAPARTTYDIRLARTDPGGPVTAMAAPSRNSATPAPAGR